MDIISTSTMKMLGLWVLLTLLGPVVFAQQLCEECNCHISSTDADSQTIYNMGLLCNTGTVTWYGASGGVLLELSPFIHGNFKACFVVESDQNTFVKISQENSHTLRRSNYRLKQREIKRLRLDHISTSSGRSKEFCVVSTRKDPVLLYMEAVRTPGTDSVSKVVIHYDMEKTDSSRNDGVAPHLDECRPCTKEELLDFYCTMDFAVVGTMSEVKDNLDTDKTDITLAIKQVIHTTHPDRFQRVRRSDPHLTGKVIVPRKCGVRKGLGDLLFLGRMRLGDLSLKCAPYFHEWRNIQNETECSHS